jgi:hypothetical protein
VRCLAVDHTGTLLISGDEAGAVVLRVLQPPAGFRVTTATGATTIAAAAAAGTRTAAYVHTVQAHEGPVFAAAHVAAVATSVATSVTAARDSPNRLSFVTGGVGGCARVWAVELGSSNSSGSNSSGSNSSSIRVTALQELLVGGFQITCLAAGLGTTAFSASVATDGSSSSTGSGSAVILAGTLQGTVFAFKAPAIEVRLIEHKH